MMTKSVNKRLSMKPAHIAFLWLLTLMSSLNTFAQKVTWNIKADTTSILIGEQIQLTLRASVPNGTMVLWPNIIDSINAAEVLQRSGIDSTPLDSESLLEERITVTVWDSGYYVLEPLPLVIAQDTLFSNPVFLTVRSVEQLQESPFDIKDPLDAPKTLGEWIAQLGPWIVTLIALILLIRWWRKRPKNTEPKPEKIIRIDPYEQALNELGELLESKLWQQGEVKEYYDHLTDIPRRYLELGHGIPALERTTDETRELLAKTTLAQEVQSDFMSLMQEADQVKFAKKRYNDEACERAYRRAKSFIDSVHTALSQEPKREEP